MRVMIAAAAIAATGAAASAQTDFRLDLSFQAREVINGVVADVDPIDTSNAIVGKTYRVELRYRIADLKADSVGSRGLSVAFIKMSAGGSGAPQITGLTRSTLTSHQLASVHPWNPDSTGLVAGSTGLIGEFRTGLANDNAQPNGSPSINGYNILPLSLNNIGANYNSWNDTGDGLPTPANTNQGTQTWAIYSFDFVYNGGIVNFGATPDYDPATGNSFGMFARGTADDRLLLLAQRFNAAQYGFSAASLSFIPAPAAAPLLGIAAIAAVRRRR